MRKLFRYTIRHPFEIDGLYKYLLLALVAVWLLSGCISKVQIPPVEQFHFVSGDQKGSIDADAHGETLLKNLYQLIKANEGVEVPICKSERDSRQCVKDGIGVFVLGGVIPGIGQRTCYVFSDIALGEQQLSFSKDNRGTKFIGTPMMTRANTCRVMVRDGGLQVEMTKYYANWMGVGNMTMAEGWAIDFMNLDHGIVGLQLELDIKGILTAGGGSRYVLLKFPNIPESFAQPTSQPAEHQTMPKQP